MPAGHAQDKRNLARFPDDFMFQLSPAETEQIRRLVSPSVMPQPGAASNSSQTVMSSGKHRGHAYRPYAFTEQGVAMLSRAGEPVSVLTFDTLRQ